MNSYFLNAIGASQESEIPLVQSQVQFYLPPSLPRVLPRAQNTRSHFNMILTDLHMNP